MADILGAQFAALTSADNASHAGAVIKAAPKAKAMPKVGVAKAAPKAGVAKAGPAAGGPVGPSAGSGGAPPAAGDAGFLVSEDTDPLLGSTVEPGPLLGGAPPPPPDEDPQPVEAEVAEQKAAAVDQSTQGTDQHFSISTDVRPIQGGWVSPLIGVEFDGRTSCILIVSASPISTHSTQHRRSTHAHSMMHME